MAPDRARTILDRRCPQCGQGAIPDCDNGHAKESGLMSQVIGNTVKASADAPKLPDGVVDLSTLTPGGEKGFSAFVHYNGPTDQLSAMSLGMAVLQPGVSPHPVHQHPEEEFLIIASGTGEIECDGKKTAVGPGAVMYSAGNVWHGITNTGKVPLTFYWSKWLGKSA
jgi:mannose-6-phosphate isomerase-like protein (cupin superfamily)